MGREWDSFSPAGFQAWCEKWAAECLRVLRPGGHLLAFGGTRTYHRLVCGIEDAGFEVRDSLHWIYGSGFPKSLDVSKAIDKLRRRDYVQAAIELGLAIPGNSLHDWTKAEHSPGDAWWERFKAHLSAEDWAAVEREVVGQGYRVRRESTVQIAGVSEGAYDLTVPATDDAARWSGWGSALKPAHEPIVLARKPLTGTVAQNVVAHGTGALNVDGCRVAGGNPSVTRRASARANDWSPAREAGSWANDRRSAESYQAERPGESAGRWPPNILLTHSAGCVRAGTRQVRGGMASPNSGAIGSGEVYRNTQARADGDFGGGYIGPDGTETVEAWACVAGCPVAELDRQSGNVSGVSTGMRQTGGKVTFTVGEDINTKQFTRNADRIKDYGGASRFFPIFRYEAKASAAERPRSADGTAHPTVKPVDLMAWLVRLVTPPGGLVLDPFAGSGTTAEACIVEGFRCVLIEKDPAYVDLIRARLRRGIQPGLFGYG